jgi:hypothetical protein
MALLGNYSVLYNSAGSFRSGGATGQGLDRANFNKGGPIRNRFTASAIDPRTAYPLGTAPGNAIVIAQKAGGIGSRNNVIGLGLLSAAGARGINIEASSDGTASLAAIGQLVVSAVSTISGSATFSGSILAALAASATLSSQGDLNGAATAVGWAIAALQGQASSDFTPYATGALAAAIDVAATTDLTAAGIADEILDQQMVETGLTVRETLRLCAAALAGKVSIAGNTVTIRNAVADTEDRIVATTTTDGERTAVTYDLG